jgi:hypothetical protein
MASPDLIRLRLRVYQKSSHYHHALGAYWNACTRQSSPEIKKQRLNDSHAFAVQLDDALGTLIQYLQSIEITDQLARELQQTVRLRELLHREMDIEEELERHFGQ